MIFHILTKSRKRQTFCGEPSTDHDISMSITAHWLNNLNKRYGGWFNNWKPCLECIDLKKAADYHEQKDFT